MPMDPLSSQTLSLEPVETVHLARSPLVVVVAQAQFAPIDGIVSDPEMGSALKSLLLDDYPEAILEADTIALPPLMAPTTIRKWAFKSLDGSWTATVATDFAAVASTSYSNREELRTRFRQVLLAVDEVAAPRVLTRIGVRYIDRIDDPSVIDRLPRMIRREMLGAIAATNANVSVTEQVTHVVLRADETTVLMRALLVPSNARYDAMVSPVENPSWVLDIDAFQEQRGPFKANDVSAITDTLGEAVYSAFRWVVTPEFLKEFS